MDNEEREISKASAPESMRAMDGYDPVFDDLAQQRWWQYTVAILLLAGLVYAILNAMSPDLGGGVQMKAADIEREQRQSDHQQEQRRQRDQPGDGEAQQH